MKFTVYIPTHLQDVSRHIILVVFKSFWKAEASIVVHNKDYYKITNDEGDEEFIFPAFFINEEKGKWHTLRKKSVWGLEIKELLEEKNFPVLFKQNRDETIYDYEIDFFGTLFFLLTRYHERVELLDNDNHYRVVADQTFLVRNNLINRPIADIYVQKFKEIIQKKFKVNIFSENSFKILPSHDVDRPFEYLYYSKKHLLKRVAGDALIRKSLQKAGQRIRKYRQVKSGDLEIDPYNTFTWIMDTSEKSGRKSTFHFIAQNTNSKYDQEYDLENPEIINLLKDIHLRGHQIGLHPSYSSAEQMGQIAKEFKRLKKVCYSNDIIQNTWKSRNHFLRWNKDCLSELENSGVHVDQTLGFAGRPGFRCGTCKSFPAFNFKEMKTSSVIIEPLILMEVSLFNTSYLGLGNTADAWNIASELREQCKKHRGNFTLLWHNNNLVTNEMKEFYTSCIQ